LDQTSSAPPSVETALKRWAILMHPSGMKGQLYGEMFEPLKAADYFALNNQAGLQVRRTGPQ
jgi:hypothetical protein